jgi:tetratricopeptide (TPR) repeat protein
LAGRINRLSFIPLTGFFLLIGGCAALTLHQSRDEFYTGRQEKAEARMETISKVRGRNKALFLMERGLIYQANGRYEKSNLDFLEAARQTEKLETISVLAQTGSFFSSDLSLSYSGEPFETVLVHTYSAMNFLKMKKWGNALIECKRALKKLSRSSLPDKQPFTNYLAGICYEIMGEYDDARIEYEKVRKACPWIPFLQHDLKRISDMPKTCHKSEFICFIQIGKSPIKHSVETFIPPDKRFVIPEYQPRKYRGRRTLVLAARLCPPAGAGEAQAAQSSKSYLLTDLEALAKKTIRERMGREITREIARLAAKEKVSKEIEERSSETAANLARIGFMLAESADTRSWQTLPAKLEIARLSLDAGTYDVRVQFFDANNALLEESLFKQVKAEPGRKVFLFSRSFL